jgi:DNA-binding CsgD family transcriptional regulator
MAKQQLTERQQEIKDRIEQGKTADEIGQELGITANAVYQQIRRMRQGKGTTRKAAAPKNTGRKSAGTPPAKAAAAPAPVVETVVRTQTPLQAVRARRDEIKASVKDAADALTVANTAVREAQLAYDKAWSKNEPELKVLDAAESALTGKKVVDGKAQAPKPKPASAPKASGKANGRAKGAEPVSEPASAPGESVEPPAPAERAPEPVRDADADGFHDPAETIAPVTA